MQEPRDPVPGEWRVRKVTQGLAVQAQAFTHGCPRHDWGLATQGPLRAIVTVLDQGHLRSAGLPGRRAAGMKAEILSGMERSLSAEFGTLQSLPAAKEGEAESDPGMVEGSRPSMPRPCPDPGPTLSKHVVLCTE